MHGERADGRHLRAVVQVLQARRHWAGWRGLRHRHGNADELDRSALRHEPFRFPRAALPHALAGGGRSRALFRSRERHGLSAALRRLPFAIGSRGECRNRSCAQRQLRDGEIHGHAADLQSPHHECMVCVQHAGRLDAHADCCRREPAVRGAVVALHARLFPRGARGGRWAARLLVCRRRSHVSSLQVAGGKMASALSGYALVRVQFQLLGLERHNESEWNAQSVGDHDGERRGRTGLARHRLRVVPPPAHVQLRHANYRDGR